MHRFCPHLAAVGLLFGCAKKAAEPPVLLGAAATLRAGLPALVTAYRQAHGGPELAASFASSGNLRQQVEGGAPFDAVLLASGSPVDALVQNGLAEGATRHVIATNQLVLVGAKEGPPLRFETLETLPAGESIAIGEPRSVPAGQYARSALEKLGKWKALEGRMVFGQDVTAVLAYARRNEVAAAIVYKTDLHGISDVRLLDEARGSWAPRAEVVVAATRAGRNGARARDFLTFLSSAEGQRILREYGFGPP